MRTTLCERNQLERQCRDTKRSQPQDCNANRAAMCASSFLHNPLSCSPAHLSGPKATLDEEDLRLQDICYFRTATSGEAERRVNRAANDRQHRSVEPVVVTLAFKTRWPAPLLIFSFFLRPEIKGTCLELEGTAKQTLGRAER